MMRVPSDEYRRVALSKPAKLPKGADALAYRALGWWRRRGTTLEELRRQAEAVDALAGSYADLSDAALRERLRESAAAFRRGDRVRRPGARIEALAAVREAARRQTGLRPFVVQLMGALALDDGTLAEMATGEGKSLTAALASVLAGWRGRPCHVVTVNDYLAERDARKFAAFYRYCGLSVGHVVSTMEPPERRAGYAADITYTTSKEVLADFLRDRLKLGAITQPERRLLRQILNPRAAGTDDLVMRGLGTAIIDEADSVLIDEAVTPLIICQPRGNHSMDEAAAIAAELAQTLEAGTHYTINTQHREVELLTAADGHLEKAGRAMPRFWSGLGRRRELVTQALTAREFYQRDRHYVVQDGKVVIVDEFTGRLMPQRTWREGLHQAIEVKEKLPLTAPTEILARLSFQRFFRSYPRLCGMTGTGRESAAEFWRIYGLPVVAIPTNRPCVREQWPEVFHARSAERWAAVAEEIAAVHASGRPVLAGTRSVAASEELARALGARGLSCQILNAVRHAEEAEIVARAGEAGRITIATNLAGRGTDILLGAGVAALGGLHVIATEPNDSGRVDRQLFGRAGRQGNPGSARRFACLEDDLVRRFVPGPIREKAGRLLGRDALTCGDREQEQRIPRDVVIQERDAVGEADVARAGQKAKSTRVWPARTAVRYAQMAAQWLAARQRAGVLRHDTWMDEALSFTGPDAGS